MTVNVISSDILRSSPTRVSNSLQEQNRLTAILGNTVWDLPTTLQKDKKEKRIVFG